MDKKELFRALTERRYADMRRMLAGGADINALADWDACAVDPSGLAPGDTLLHYALWKKDRDGVEMLLSHNPNINISGRDGISPLRMAISIGMTDIAIWLIDHGADFTGMDKYGMSPIHATDDPPLIRILLSKGVPVDTPAQCNGWTPLRYASYHNQWERTQVLLQAGASTSATGHDGETPLHVLCALPYRDVSAIVALLLECNANIDAQDRQGNTALYWAMGINASSNWMDRGNPNAAAFLRFRGAKTDIRNARRISPMDLAKKQGGEYLQSMKKDARTSRI